jgi:hypothetical protein
MPTEEYMDDSDIYYEDELDNMNNISSESSNKNDTFTKVQRQNKKKNILVLGEDEYGNERCIFCSKGQGTYICNATTGYKTSYKVGSHDEDLFFSMIDSRSCDKIKEPIIFYFDSPEQCERLFSNHFKNFHISQKTKELWHKKFLLAKNRIINKN